MSWKHGCAMLAITAMAATAARAQSDPPPAAGARQDGPRLIEIMSIAQLQHLKLWYAGKARNWELAAHELRHLTASLAEAAIFYPAIPIGNVTTMKEPLLAVSGAIAARDDRQFAASMRTLSDGCNSCHGAMDRGFIAIAVPAGGQPPPNQVFAPRTR